MAFTLSPYKEILMVSGDCEVSISLGSHFFKPNTRAAGEESSLAEERVRKRKDVNEMN